LLSQRDHRPSKLENAHCEKAGKSVRWAKIIGGRGEIWSGSHINNNCVLHGNALKFMIYLKRKYIVLCANKSH